MIPVHELEVKRQIVFTNFYKKLLENTLPISQKILSLQSKIDNFSEDELEKNAIQFGWNISKYGEFNWEKGKIYFEKTGPWPGMAGISHSFTRGNILDVAKEIDFYRNSPNEDFLPPKLNHNLYEIQKNADFAKNAFLPIILPGHTIRKRDSLAKRLGNDVWDGNTRMVAFALNGEKSCEAYIAHFQ